MIPATNDNTPRQFVPSPADTDPREYSHDGIVLGEDEGVSLAECQGAMDRINAWNASKELARCFADLRPEGR